MYKALFRLKITIGVQVDLWIRSLEEINLSLLVMSTPPNTGEAHTLGAEVSVWGYRNFAPSREVLLN